MASRATWADAYRGAGHRETASWHFTDIELDHPDLNAACFGFPPANGPASQGQLRTARSTRLRSSRRSSRIGARHSPSASWRLSTCCTSSATSTSRCTAPTTMTGAATACTSAWVARAPRTCTATGTPPSSRRSAPIRRRSPINSGRRSRLRRRRSGKKGHSRSWAQEAYSVARSVAYTVGSQPGCAGDAGPLPLRVGYAERSEAAAKVQLERAGVRLAAELNRALAKC